VETTRVLRATNGPPVNSPWRLIRDQKVREAEVRAETGVRRLEEEGKVLVERQDHVDVELTRMGESEAGVKAHRKLGHWWGTGFTLAAAVVILTARWTLNWYLSLTWETWLLALTLFIVPLIGWAVFLNRQPGEVSSRVLMGLSLAAVYLALTAGVLFGVGRTAGVLLQEDRQQLAAVQPTGELNTPSNNAGPNPMIARVKKLLSITTMVPVILLGVAGEIVLGLVFHVYYRHMTVVWTVWPYYRERARLSDAIADNVARQEEVRRWPEILHAQLTAAGLEQEAAEAGKAAADARAAEEKAREAAEADAKANSLGRLVKIVLLAGGMFVLVLLAVAAAVFAEERHATVVILDLSTSMASEEFARDVQAVEGAIERLPADTRLVVLGVTEASFSTPPLFVQTSPKNAGRFGEYLSAWRGKAIREWRLVAERLQPSAKGSDILGALARASTEFAELPQASKTLILLSDMRQVGQGVNLEKRPAPSVSSLEQGGLINRLPDVQVWMLGVHTEGIDVGHWRELQAFWCQYFRKAGAEVKAFSPNRRVAAR